MEIRAAGHYAKTSYCDCDCKMCSTVIFSVVWTCDRMYVVTKCALSVMYCNAPSGSWHPLIIIHVNYTTYSDLAVLAYILMCVPGPSSLSHTVSSFPLFPATKTAPKLFPAVLGQ